MKMLFPSTVICSAIFLVTACSKSIDEPQATKNGSSVAAADSAAVYNYLVDKNWKFYEHFTHYCDTGTLNNFKENRSQNSFPPDWFNRMKFEIDNVYWEVDEYGAQRSGNWYLVNGGNTVQIITDQGTRYITPTRLEDNRFEWTDSTCNYGYMIPEDYTPGYDTSVANMFTAHTWKYESYMTNYQSSSAGVLYRYNKSNNLVDLSLYRLTLNTNGTYTEIDQNGNTIHGTWAIISTGFDFNLELTNTSGTTTMGIHVINNDRFEWISLDFNDHGELVPE